jgi:hypothetical protein
VSTNREKIRAITEYARAHIKAMQEAKWTWERIAERFGKTHAWAHRLMKPGGQHQAFDLDTVLTMATVFADGSVDDLVAAAESRAKPPEYQPQDGTRVAPRPVKRARKKPQVDAERVRTAKGRPSA